MKIAVFEMEEWEQTDRLSTKPHEMVGFREPLDPTTAKKAADAEIVTTFVQSRLDAAVLAELPKLRLVATRSTGYDHIDLDYCAAHGITVCNVPDYGDHTVAEHAFALLLAIARDLVDAVERTRRGIFTTPPRRGFDLYGKTLGVVGTGRIGRCAIGIAKGFGMDVLAYDTHPDRACADTLGFRYAELAEVLRRADAVTLHVPAAPGTRNLLADAEFQLMKPHAVLINTARGNVIDVPALVRALAEGRLAGAGLDVLPQEPLIREEAEIFRAGRADQGPDYRALVANHVLLRFGNVIVTPHIAFNTNEALHRIIEVTLSNIEAFMRGAPTNVVHKQQ
jgi:D-lactate dehydrogenase